MWIEVLCLIPATLAAGYLGIKLCCPWLLLDIRYVMKVVPAISALKKRLQKKYFIIEHFENTVKLYPERTFLLFEDKSFTYKVNQFSLFFLSFNTEYCLYALGFSVFFSFYLWNHLFCEFNCSLVCKMFSTLNRIIFNGDVKLVFANIVYLI